MSDDMIPPGARLTPELRRIAREAQIKQAHDENMKTHDELMTALDGIGSGVVALAQAINRLATDIERRKL